MGPPPTQLLTPPSQLPRPQLLRKPSTSNLLLLLPSTPFKDLRPRPVLFLSPLSSLDSVRVRNTLGCAKLPRSPHLTQLSEPPWLRETPKPPSLQRKKAKETLLSGVLSSLPSS